MKQEVAFGNGFRAVAIIPILVYGFLGLVARESIYAQRPVANANEALAEGPFVRMVRHNDGSRSVGSFSRDQNI